MLIRYRNKSNKQKQYTFYCYTLLSLVLMTVEFSSTKLSKNTYAVLWSGCSTYIASH